MSLLEQQAERYGKVSSFFIDCIGIDLDTLTTAWIVSARKDTGVVVVHGAFDAARIEARFGYLPTVTRVQRPGIPFAGRFVDEKDPTKHKLAAVIDGSTIVVGDLESVDRFLAVRNDPEKLLPADHPAIRRVADSTHHLAVTLFGDLAKWEDFDPNMASVAEYLTLVGDAGADVSFTLTVRTGTAEQAEALSNIGKGLAQLKAVDPKTQAKPLILALLRSAAFEQHGTEASVKVSLTGEQLRQRLAGQP